MLVRRILLAAALVAPIVHAQTPPPVDQPTANSVPTFSVVSIKQDKVALGWRSSLDSDGYSARGITLKYLIIDAYNIRPDYRIIGAPKWWDDTRYDIEARVDDPDIGALAKLSYFQREAMLQQILTDRFKLVAHREARIQPVYSLIVVKPGLMVETPRDPNDVSPGGRIRPGQGTRTGQNNATVESTAWLAEQLSWTVGRMIVDNTGLTGHYSAKLHWTREDAPLGDSSGDSAPEISIFTALQEQLGLKLVPTKGPVECLVIDHVEMPSEN